MTNIRLNAAIILLFASACVCGCATTEQEGIRIGNPAPSFSLLTYERDRVTNESLKGQIVILNFWSTGCLSCIKELPELQEVASSAGVKVIGIALNTDGGWEAVKPILERHGVTYPVALGNDDLFSRFDCFSIPYTVILDRSLRIARIHRGAVTREVLEQDIRAVAGNV
jgi:thiol-disulfide isomerase/thioredoxin